MLALNILRYWWLKPHMTDPRHKEFHDPLKASSITSLLDPPSGPQFKTQKQWSKISHFYGGSDPKERSIIEIERELALGKDLILVEPEMAGQNYYHYVAHGWLLQESTMIFGGVSLFVSYFFPTWWKFYSTCSFLALMHSYVYFRVYKFDRLSQYQAYDDDRHPVSNLITAWIMGQRPDHFQYVLKKEKVVHWEIFTEVILYAGMISTLKSLAFIETMILGEGKVELAIDPEALISELATPAFKAGYFRPPDIVPESAYYYLPTDIPFVSGWFDLPCINFRPKPIRYDLAMIISGLGVYFLYKAIEHFFISPDEVDEVCHEWLQTEEAKKELAQAPKDPQWVTIEDYTEKKLLGKRRNTTEEEELIERNEVTRITSRAPYGHVAPGYPENHYGIYT